MEQLTTGRLAQRAQVNPQTIRYYEREGILQSPKRSSSGYRIFSADTVRHIRFIKRAQTLGFSLDQIRDLLSLRSKRTGEETADVKRMAREKIAEIDRKMEALAKMRSILRELEEQCPGSGPLSECPILGSLELDAQDIQEPAQKLIKGKSNHARNR